MALPADDSSVGHSFGMEFDGVVVAQLYDVSGLKLEQDVIELKESTPDGGVVVKRLPGRFKAGEVTLTRGVTHDNTFSDWVRSAASRQPDERPRDGAIIVYDHEGTVIKRYRLQNARPRSVEVAATRSGDTSILTEKLVVAYEAVSVE